VFWVVIRVLLGGGFTLFKEIISGACQCKSLHYSRLLRVVARVFLGGCLNVLGCWQGISWWLLYNF